MDTLLPFALLCFTSFFTLTNPLGTMPVFLTMTKGMDDEEQRQIELSNFVFFLSDLEIHLLYQLLNCLVVLKPFMHHE
jgi:small neutral amino acid transporter SnatA (MarC family)